MRHTWTEAEDRILIDTNATHTTQQQAALLGYTVTSVRGRRQHLRARGLLPSHERAYGRVWTADERAHMEALVLEGKPVKQIAKVLGRGIPAIYSQIARYGLGVSTLRGSIGLGVRSASAVARLMAVADTTVALWIERGWLKARRDNTWRSKNKKKRRNVGRPRFLITDENLMAFLEEKAAWVSWNVDKIADVDWREYACGVRASAGGEWLSTLDMAARYCYGDSTVLGWWQRGCMPGVRTILWRQTRYFWSGDLVGFVPPQERRFAA